MSSSKSGAIILVLLGCALSFSFIGCQETIKPPISTSPSSPSASSSPTPSPAATPVSAPAKTEPGTGNLEGAVRWNSQPAKELDVKLCQDMSQFSGCSGKEITAKTDQNGKFQFTNVPAGDYALLIRVFETDSWIFPSEGVAGLKSKKFQIAESRTLTVSTQNIYKTDLKLENPTDGAEIDTAKPTLKWQAYPQAAYYKLYLATQDLGKPYEESFVNQKVETNQFELPRSLGKCKYTWKIQAFNREGVKIAENDNYAKFSVKTCAKQP